MNQSDSKSIGFEDAGIDAAMNRAAERAREIGRRTGTPVWILVDGKLVDALAEERAESNGPNANGKSGG